MDLFIGYKISSPIDYKQENQNIQNNLKLVIHIWHDFEPILDTVNVRVWQQCMSCDVITEIPVL